jgi:hypothetical protein
MADRVGTAFALTVFTRVLPGHVDELQSYIDALPLGAQSPLARVDTLHVARIQIFRSLVHQGPAQKHVDELLHAHLLFTSTVDGELGAYLDALAERVPEADGWWGHCVGYPGRADVAAFGAWIRVHHVRTSLFASGMPRTTVADARTAIALRERVIDFAVAVQGLEADDLQRRFRAEFVR